MTLHFGITSPVKNTIVGRSVTVSGRARSIGVAYPIYAVEEVRVAFGGGAEQVAQLVQGSWTCVVSALPNIGGGTPLRIVATAHGTVIDNIGTPTDPLPGEPEPFEQRTTVDVILDGSAPTIAIDSFLSPVTTQPGRPFLLDLSGKAGDPQTGIGAVRLQVDDGPFVDVVDVVDNGSGLWLWRQKEIELPPGVHHFTVQALDGASNSGTARAEIVVRLPFEPGAVEQVFQPSRYLLDLREFAHRYVVVAGSTSRSRSCAAGWAPPHRASWTSASKGWPTRPSCGHWAPPTRSCGWPAPLTRTRARRWPGGSGSGWSARARTASTSSPSHRRRSPTTSWKR